MLNSLSNTKHLKDDEMGNNTVVMGPEVFRLKEMSFNIEEQLVNAILIWTLYSPNKYTPNVLSIEALQETVTTLEYPYIILREESKASDRKGRKTRSG